MILYEPNFIFIALAWTGPSHLCSLSYTKVHYRRMHYIWKIKFMQRGRELGFFFLFGRLGKTKEGN